MRRDESTAHGRAYLDGDVPPEFSDDALALEFVDKHGAGLRWTPGLDWMRNTGTHWRGDDELHRYDLARGICRAAAVRADGKSEKKRLAAAGTVNAVLQMARADRRVVLPADAWDADPMLLNTPAGIVDLRDGRLRARRQDDYCTQLAAVAPDARIKSPNWLRFIGEVFGHDPEMVEFVQRALGYCLTGDRREQKILFLHGTGANGKSTLLDLVLWLAGTYALKLPAAALMQTKTERHPTELAQLRGRRLAVSSELEEGQFWAESRIKELTGDELLTARFMRQDFFEFRQTHKHLIAGNYKPRLRGGDAALARRFVLVPFTATFEGVRRDPLLPAKLRAEAPAVLAWLIEGAAKWHDSGLLIPARVREASAEYMTANDDVGLWLEECCNLGPDYTDAAGELYAAFRQWKQDRGEHAPSQTTWGERISLVPGIARFKSDGRKVYRGVALKAEARDKLYAADRGGRPYFTTGR
jgi:putative DNA primase/helicase